LGHFVKIKSFVLWLLVQRKEISSGCSKVEERTTKWAKRYDRNYATALVPRSWSKWCSKYSEYAVLECVKNNKWSSSLWVSSLL
jgi:uncharacterized protein YceK